MGERAKMMRCIQMYDFALIEVGMFLNTHPNNAEALAYYRQTQALRDEAVALYEKRFGPLTMMSPVAAEGCWKWVEGPWPWEGED